MKQILIKVLFVLFGMFIGMEAFAQFYDDDKVYFYVTDRDQKDDKYCQVFIFDGYKLGIMSTYYSTIRRCLKTDINSYEKDFNKFQYDAEYNSNKSDTSWTVYSQYFWYLQSGIAYRFSKDRKQYTFERYNSEGISVAYRGTLVDKSYFLKGSKYNVENNEGTIYE